MTHKLLWTAVSAVSAGALMVGQTAAADQADSADRAHKKPAPPAKVRNVEVFVDRLGVASVTFRITDCTFDPARYELALGEVDLAQAGAGGYFANFQPYCGSDTVHIQTEARSLPFHPGDGGNVTIALALCPVPHDPTAICNKKSFYQDSDVRFRPA